MKIRFIDLFAGIGGFRYGLETVNRTQNRRSKEVKEVGGGKRYKELKETDSKGGQSCKHNNWGSTRQKSFTCVYSNEWDKYASQIYKKHYGECDTTDITKVNAKDIPDHDLLCAGFPCQSFSIAGKRKGFDDTRGTMFFEIARILSEKRPRLVLLENVKGLLNHDQGKTFQTILGVLSDLGYRVEWQILNSKHFGVPQNRERVFIIGHLGGFGGRKVFPIISKSKETVDSREVAGTLQADYFKGDRTGGYVIKAKRFPLKFTKRNQKNIDGEHSYTVDGANTGGVAVRTDKKNTQQKGNKPDSSNRIRKVSYTDDMRIRRLTPTECERLQGFPDGWTIGISDTQRYKCLGNAVTTNVVTAIGERLK